MPTESERMKILKQIEDGQIDAAEGLKRLEAVGRAEAAPAGGGKTPRAIPPDLGAAKWQRWWLIPASLGLVITLLGGALMYWGWQSAGFGFWFVCAWFPFLLGVLVLALSFPGPAGRWIHVRVKTGQDEWPRQISISLPLAPAAWALRTFGQFIPQLKQTGVDEIIQALGEGVTPQAPLVIDVAEGEGGEQVQVYIG
jgi:hypothetical protein